MTERLVKCPLCKSGHFLNYHEVKDFAVSKEIFLLTKCSECQLIFTNPRPSAENIGPYYDFPEYYSHQTHAKSLTHWIYNRVKKKNLADKLALLSSLTQERTLLDYGCGAGDLIHLAQQKGWKVTGIEPNIGARTIANQKSKNRVKESIHELKKNKEYSIITLFHVLEHIHELRKTVKKLVTHLKPNGYLIFAVPNPESWDAKKYGDHWAGWDVPRHLYHFNQEAMKQFQYIFDLNLLDQKPMKFDSYYVSLLSEGYKANNATLVKKYLNAILSGYQSNKQAKRQNNYSSNIYIFQKK
ncbi:class I SAM-dependent methyltransferase [Algoriphagus confluentis]|uniref:Class I SAM-dependent methyltransferase n=1 Tax=Algoriphagus confluentis TaxID=1697556 RepID=A0ABQ6PTR4_9BACT|nr:class I SAM-dependent methyltransferase [Algoriphagus confluentis]